MVYFGNDPWWKRLVRGVLTTPMPGGSRRRSGDLPLPVTLGVPLNEYLEDLRLWSTLRLIRYEDTVAFGARQVVMQHASVALAAIMADRSSLVTAEARRRAAELAEAALVGSERDLRRVLSTALQRTVQHEAHVAGELGNVWDQYRERLQALPPWRVPPVGGFASAVNAEAKNWWLDDFLEGISGRAAAQVRQQALGAYLAGQSTQDLARDVRRVFDRYEGEAEAFARTTLHRLAGAYQQQVYRENADVLKGQKYLATLDDRTCPICGADDGKVFEVGEGPTIPQHPYCRCTYAPVTRSVRDLLGLPAGGERSDDDERLRRSMDGMVPRRTTWQDWLARKEAQQPGFALDVLGRTRYDAWRAGEVDLADLSARGRLRTLSALGLR